LTPVRRSEAVSQLTTHKQLLQDHQRSDQRWTFVAGRPKQMMSVIPANNPISIASFIAGVRNCVPSKAEERRTRHYMSYILCN